MSVVADLVRDLAAHVPRDGRERWSVSRARALLAWLPSPLDQRADPAHVTGSAVVLDAGDRVLLHRHKRLGIWLQPGGHLEPGEAPAAAAVRETAEETGVVAAHPGAGPGHEHGTPVLVHVDVHEGPRGHVHLDLRYLLRATDTTLAPAPGESPEVGWFDREEACRRGDASVASAIAAALTRPRGGPR